ncbi:MAG: nitroreductase [Reichenbachiella sp.]|uniref:nitroreductase family protein n=1 Tax=Reichenbachiella sp. TaxID=2184521 RepID=UPI003263D34D
MTFDPVQVSHLIKNRRSIFPKNYSGERVADEVIMEMLENANWAPTHKMTEPWRFTVFCDEGIESFADYQAERYLKSAGKKPDADRLKKLKSKPLMCSHIISIGMKRNKSVPKMEEVAAVAAAVQNMHLTATANGVGCYWSTGGVTYDKKAKAFFELGDKDLLMGFLYIGIPKADKWPIGKRKSIDKKVRWIKK